MNHRLRTIDNPPRPLHPIEVAILAKATAQGCYVRICTCGMFLASGNEVDLYAQHNLHRREVARTAG